LKVFDLLGREITILVNEYKTIGKYHLTLDANKLNIASGIYFYKLETGEYSSLKKMIYLK